MTSSGSWSTNDTSKATIDASSALLSGVAPGGFNIFADLFLDDPTVSYCDPAQYDYLGNPVNSCPHADPVISPSPGNTVTATITVHFSGSKTTGDSLTFPSSVCGQSLGLQNCSTSGNWRWSVEVQATVSDDASNWTVSQSWDTGRKKGNWKDSSNNLHAFDLSPNSPNDTPDSSFVQQTSGQKQIFWLDSPGHGYQLAANEPIDSITQVQNFTSKICNKSNTATCFSVHWYLKLVVNAGAVLDTTNSTAAIGTASTSF